jgi:hypothetical protein
MPRPRGSLDPLLRAKNQARAAREKPAGEPAGFRAQCMHSLSRFSIKRQARFESTPASQDHLSRAVEGSCGVSENGNLQRVNILIHLSERTRAIRGIFQTQSLGSGTQSNPPGKIGVHTAQQ